MPVHIPVMLDEVLEWLAPHPGQVLVDGTLGAGGHTRSLAERVEPGGTVLAFDRDPAARDAAEKNLAGLSIKLADANYCELPEVLEQLGIPQIDGMLLDLGLSSDQLADAGRGFSFDADGPLDLRFNPAAGQSASDLVNRLSAEQLADIIYEYGEERFSRRIARKIVEQRRQKPIEQARELAELVRRCVPRSGVERIDRATRTFQALRIAVNDELGSLEKILKVLPDCLRVGARVAIISFHSLEDRRVKQAFRDDPRYAVLTRKPLLPTAAEIDRNPRREARSCESRPDKLEAADADNLKEEARAMGKREIITGGVVVLSMAVGFGGMLAARLRNAADKNGHASDEQGVKDALAAFHQEKAASFPAKSSLMDFQESSPVAATNSSPAPAPAADPMPPAAAATNSNSPSPAAQSTAAQAANPSSPSDQSSAPPPAWAQGNLGGDRYGSAAASQIPMAPAAQSPPAASSDPTNPQTAPQSAANASTPPAADPFSRSPMGTATLGAPMDSTDSTSPGARRRLHRLRRQSRRQPVQMPGPTPGPPGHRRAITVPVWRAAPAVLPLRNLIRQASRA